MTINELKIGMTYELRKSFSSEEVVKFSQLSLDNNPVHTDDAYAQDTIFKSKIVHGFLSGSLFSAIIGTKLPGNGSIYLNQTMNFRRPIFHNQLVVARVTIVDIKYDKNIVFLDTVCYDEYNNILIDGTAVVKII